MDPIHKAKLKRNYVQIVNDLDPKDVVDDLYQDGILTDNDCERVTNSNKTRKERCENLISVLTKRGPLAFESFLGAIRCSKYSHIADLIIPDVTATDSVPCGKNGENTSNSNDACEECSPYFPVSFLNPDIEDILKRHCCLILQNVEPKDLLPYSYQEDIFSEDECDRIKTGETRKDRCALYLKELSKSRKDKLIILLKASLQKKYQYIVERIQQPFVSAKSCTETDSVPISITPRCRINESSIERSTVLNQTDPCTRYKKYYVNTDSSTSQLKQREDYFSQTLKLEEDRDVNCTKQKHTKLVNCTNAYEVKIDNCPSTKRTRRDITPEEGQLVTVSGTTEIVPFLMSPGASKPDTLPNKRLDVAFNTLVSMMNRGLFDQFNGLTTRLRRRYRTDFDMKCVLGYLQANLELHKSNFDGAKKHIESALTICGKTTNTRYFTLELLGTKARMLLYQKKFETLQDVVDAAKMIIETDVVASSGRAAGWLHVQEGRLMAAQIDLLNPTRVNFIGAHGYLHDRAKASFEKALANFQEDKSEYGPVGFVYTMCRLIILLLQCGENGLTMDILQPDPTVVDMAGKYLLHVSGTDVTSRRVLSMHYHIANCDYHFRVGNINKAFECAETAHDLATLLDMNEFMVHAHNRLVFLRVKVPPSGGEINEADLSEILFGSDSCPDTSNIDDETSGLDVT
ncbi:uncharacterized protein LOC110452942 [Mizuhopecten yessoensis]|uniref:uncharacterized protein LOC110452942 n=1 Tax=Mizuhopecten yessoensis TaxID=6573 RepID=UPI000B45B88A|nr:uncharacterized protein LOC110452942 [Mizuhopecten yessoensis]